jgi:hypothetical protein
MKLSRVHSFFSYHSISESNKRIDSSVNEDETDDLSNDIKTTSKTTTKKPDPEDKESSKTSVTDKYKVNMNLDVSNKSNKSSYSAYTTLFIEALNSLDAMAALGNSVDPEAPAIKNYKTDRYDIATSVDGTAKGLKKAWDKIYQIAGTWPPSGKGITGIIKETLQKNDVYKKYFEERKKLDAELNGTPKMKQEVYDTQLAELKKKYSEMIDPKQVMALGKINNAIGLYRTAIDKFRQGADVELGFVEKREGGIKGEDLSKVEDLQKTIDDTDIPEQDRIRAAEKLKKDFPAYFGSIKTGDIINGAIDQIKPGLSEAPKKFYDELSDAISDLVLYKGSLDSKKEESVNWIGTKEKILEDFGGFLNTSKAFATGVGRGIADGFKGGPKDKAIKQGDNRVLDKASLVYTADTIKGSLAGLASEINNVLAFKKNVYGLGDNASKDTETEKLLRKSADKSKQEAKAEAAEMISFVKESFEYVVNISKELASSSVELSTVKKKLDDISKQIDIIGRKGGTLEKWKNDVLGENRERIASISYLEKGRALMQMAAAKAAEKDNQEAIAKRYRDRDADVVFKKAVDMFRGNTESALKPSMIKKRGDVKVFSKGDKDLDKTTVKTFQQRLIDLGHLPTGNLNGEFDEETKNASKLAMTYIGSLSGKVYADNEEAFQDFQRDLGFYSDNKDEIKKKMGL